MSRQIDPLGIGILIVIGFGIGVLVMVTGDLQWGESPQEAYDRGHEQGCKDIIAAYYRNQPYYKAILDGRMYEDTILMGWVIRRFQDPYLPDPTISIEHDTIVLRAWDSLGYDVLTGVHKDSLDTLKEKK